MQVRDRNTRRDRWPKPTGCVGKDRYRQTCPRCGWPCTHLIEPHYDSPWIEHGGLCGECCMEACSHFDKKGWPAMRPELIASEPHDPDVPIPMFEQGDLGV